MELHRYHSHKLSKLTSINHPLKRKNTNNNFLDRALIEHHSHRRNPLTFLRLEFFARTSLISFSVHTHIFSAPHSFFLRDYVCTLGPGESFSPELMLRSRAALSAFATTHFCREAIPTETYECLTK